MFLLRQFCTYIILLKISSLNRSEKKQEPLDGQPLIFDRLKKIIEVIGITV